VGGVGGDVEELSLKPEIQFSMSSKDAPANSSIGNIPKGR
jgi:hypothetical protein